MDIEMQGTRGTHGRAVLTQNFSRRLWREVAIWES